MIAGDAIIKSMKEQPDRWIIREFTIDHESGIRVWIANSIFDIEVHAPFKQRLPILDRFRIKRAVEVIKSKHIETALS